MSRLKPADRILAVFAALSIATYFFALARPALYNYFSADDFQSLWRCWFFPGLLKANLLFFWTSDFIRPMVANWYRLVFHFAGLNPFWFHAANFVSLMGNVFVTYAVSRRLSGSREIGLVTALFFSYTRSMDYLYFDTGFTCDVLCYFFFFSTFLFYLRVRQQGRLMRAWETVVFCILYVCALNAKEIALTFPAALAVYELLWNPPSSWRPRSLMRYALHEGRAFLIVTVFVLAMVLGRALGPGSLLSIPAYRPVFTWHQFMLTTGTFLSQATGGFDPWSQWAVLGTWAATFSVAWLSRLRELRFAWLFFMLTPIPVEFILPRGTPQYYLPWFGWMFFFTILLVKPIQFLTDKFWSGWPTLSRLRGAVLFVALIAIRYPHYKELGWENVNSESRESQPLRDAALELHRLEPKLKPGAHVLLLNDPIFTSGTLYIIVLVSYGDRNLSIYDVRYRGKMPDAAEMAAFDYIFDYRDGHYVELRGSNASAAGRSGSTGIL